jgi:hypothetical protein
MSSSESVLDAVVRLLETTATTYNSTNEEAPQAVLWPDKSGAWASLLPDLRQRVSLLALGPYDPAARQGPAFWIRAALAGALDGIEVASVPIVYLPGVSINDLRDAQHAPAPIQPLLYLRHRGVTLTHTNNKDLTVNAFLLHPDYGTGLEVDADAATQEALVANLQRLAAEPIALLRARGRITAASIHALHLPDPAREVLRWLSNDEGFRESAASEVWAAFCSVMREKYGIDPLADGALAAAAKLGSQETSAWRQAWIRFEESPGNYPGIPNLLRAAKPQQVLPLFRTHAWPQDSDAAENELRDALLGLTEVAAEARKAVHDLEANHRDRRRSVWGTLGLTPLANALVHLDQLATLTAKSLPSIDLTSMVAAYTDWGWQADAAAMDALAAVAQGSAALANRKAVGHAVRRLSYGWLDSSARAFQLVIAQAEPAAALDFEPGTCVLFADALRYDLGAQLADRFTQSSHMVSLNHRFVAIPGVTPTAKPAVSPLAPHVKPGKKFGVRIAPSASNLEQPAFRKALADRDWIVLDTSNLECPSPQARGWIEGAEFDSFGHIHTEELPQERINQLDRLQERIRALIEAGWSRVQVVTDHGWLYIPAEGLGVVELKEHLTDVRKARCARLKASATTDLQTLPWHWDANVRIAFPPGIAAFQAGVRYDHGGLSLQECVIPILTVFANTQAVPFSIASVSWRGMRLDVDVVGGSGEMLDIRLKPGDASTSLLDEPASVTGPGRVTLTVRDYDQEGAAAALVAVRGSGTPFVSRPVVIGQDES